MLLSDSHDNLKVFQGLKFKIYNPLYGCRYSKIGLGGKRNGTYVYVCHIIILFNQLSNILMPIFPF